VPGCVSVGRTLDEARAMAAEALAGHLAMLEAEGEPMPVPSSMEALRDDPNRGGAVAILVDLEPDFLKAERVNVMIPRNLLGRIDAASGGNRSRFIVEAAEQKLAG
ncbi:MAG TPA: type II toxin-antitoxin system HicB family antitoxin, partial [Candidatus Omnitrophota bacterium]|nr:type II toxin-antitoxin system HicB family antitoxin [Candidatus Omnitrophota bacterium]